LTNTGYGLTDMKQIDLLSVIIPCYNEENTLNLIVFEVLAAPIGATKKEIIIVDDCSKDNSLKIIKKLEQQYPEVIGIAQTTNQGKGAALKKGFLASKGQVVIVQDADREYDPRDYARLLDIIEEDRADIVFGTRFSGGMPRRVQYLMHTIGNKFMTLLSAALNGLYIHDIHTCYIMFDGDWIRQQAPSLTSNRFGFNPEIVARIAKNKKHIRICETSVSYYARGKEEGKKIGWKDGIAAVWDILYFNLLQK
jgi:glycosyltransferase involved in cell wall biosynthesis